MLRRLLEIACLLGLIFPANPGISGERILVHDGLVDLSAWDENQEPVIELRGEWWAFNGMLSEDDVRSGRYLTLPHRTYGVPGPIGLDFIGKENSIVTHVLHLKNIDSTVPLTIEFSQFLPTHQANIWIPQSDSYIKAPPVGTLSEKISEHVIWGKKYQIALPVQKFSEITLVIHNQTVMGNPGIIGIPRLGLSPYMQSDFTKKDIESAFILGVFALLCLNSLLLFIVRRRDWPSLSLAAYSFLLFVRYFATEAYIGKFIAMPSNFVALFIYCFMYFATASAPAIYGLFLAETFKVPRIRRWSFAAIVFNSIPLAWAIFDLAAAIKFSTIFILISYIQMLYTTYYCSRHKLDEIGNFKFVTIGLICVATAFINDILVYGDMINTPYLGHYGMLVFTIFQTFIVARNFARAHNTAERLSRHLQSEVDRQTEKLRLQKEKLEDQQKTLGKVHEELKENDEQKTRFFRSISHELRTPLTMILGTLQETDEHERLKRSVSTASRHAKRLYRLVNQLLDFQKVALSKVSLRLERVDLESFLKGIAEYVGSSCQSQGLLFHFEINRKVQGGWIVRAQIDALEKILFNYVGNAVKFTPPGGTITLKLDLAGPYARISVRDSGCGIPKDQQSKLFKLFSQIEGPQQQGRQGTGLGLALVKELILQMDGRAGVDSEVDQGAEFWVELPRRVAESDRHAILLVDPSKAHHEALKAELSRQHLDSNIYCVASLEEAQQILKSWPVQVLLVSTSLGTETGKLLELTAETHPLAWRVMITDNQRRTEIKTISAQAVQGLFSWPLDPEFFLQLQTRLHLDGGNRQAPILDLVYVDDEPTMRDAFLQAMQRYSLIDRFRIVENAGAYREILAQYRIKAVIIDANLEEPGSGIPLLAQTARLSPDTYRVLFTGDNTGELLTAALQEAQAQYIIYKPADFQKEFKVIEDVIARSPFENSESAQTNDASVNRDWQLSGALEPANSTLPANLEDDAPITGAATILIIDDLSDMRSILHDILHGHGYRVLHAGSGAQALERIHSKQETIDLIITDWMMPEVTGPEFIQKLHAFDEFAAIPTILLTAKSDEGSRSEGMRIGASAYLSKPFDYRELLSITDNLLDLKKRERKIVELNRFINENVLQRFLPPTLVHDLVNGKAVFDDAARMHSITVIFADLVDFTRSTERLGPTRIARILNAFLISMTDVIFSEGGTIDKFIGDAILVFFGAPTLTPAGDQIERATRCALRMQEALKELNKTWLEQEQHSFQMRIGIHHGPAIVGSFGGQKRSDYTAIGHTVNLTARIEGQAQPGEILMTSSVRDYLMEDCWEYAGNFRMKGVEAETPLYRLKPLGMKSAA